MTTKSGGNWNIGGTGVGVGVTRLVGNAPMYSNRQPMSLHAITICIKAEPRDQNSGRVRSRRCDAVRCKTFRPVVLLLPLRDDLVTLAMVWSLTWDAQARQSDGGVSGAEHG